MLRNIGTNTVEHLFVDASRAPAINRGLPVNTTVLPNQGVTMLLKGSWQSPMPSELYLR